LTCVADLRIIYWCVSGHYIILGRADIMPSLKFIKGLLEDPSR
jgi:hypothetical protein